MDNQRHERQWAHGADMIVSQLEAQGYARSSASPARK